LAGERIRCLAEARDERLIAGYDQSRTNRRAALGNRRSRELSADIAVEPDGFSEDQLAAAAQPPAVDELALLHPLAHGGSAEHHDLAEQERGRVVELDVEAALHARPVEQDGLLRQ